MFSFDLRMSLMLSKHIAKDSSSSVFKFWARMFAFLAADFALNRLVSCLLMPKTLDEFAMFSG